ncbi:META domain-containing protein [Leucobacter coleopterorum]|uniref:META domain-containing protein n=1 Tax=Leucobacter coleopterorum TaxID=2714933 RepID=A0ABX6JVG9_9MICO|nr:META domain-containing protein [Leucobacter coleopterorum]QIM18228.1 META domain-containing protein [Leucobacter coleopterorum]
MKSAVLRTSMFAAAMVAAILLSACTGSADGTGTADSTGSIEGTWGDPQAKGSPSLEFTADGKYTGTDGCNTVGGSFTEANDGTIDLGAMRSTRMLCEGVDTWLETAHAAKISGDKLVIKNEEGTEIGTLSRFSE